VRRREGITFVSCIRRRCVENGEVLAKRKGLSVKRLERLGRLLRRKLRRLIRRRRSLLP
jgi:hypothetical protein